MWEVRSIDNLMLESLFEVKNSDFHARLSIERTFRLNAEAMLKIFISKLIYEVQSALQC